MNAPFSSYRRLVLAFRDYLSAKPVDEVSDEDVQQFLTDLAFKQQVVASTQNLAFNALLFFFRHILQGTMSLGDRVVRAKTTKYIPVVLTRAEVDAVLERLEFPCNLIVSTLYGCGLRISECLELWLNALDFEGHLVIVRDGKGKKDCTVPMPRKLVPELEKQVKWVVAQHRRDLETNNFVGVFMPETLGR